MKCARSATILKIRLTSGPTKIGFKLQETIKTPHEESLLFWGAYRDASLLNLWETPGFPIPSSAGKQ
jgi:hypothetical protein